MTCFQFALKAFVDEPMRTGGALAAMPEHKSVVGLDDFERVLASGWSRHDDLLGCRPCQLSAPTSYKDQQYPYRENE